MPGIEIIVIDGSDSGAAVRLVSGLGNQPSGRTNRFFGPVIEAARLLVPCFWVLVCVADGVCASEAGDALALRNARRRCAICHFLENAR